MKLTQNLAKLSNTWFLWKLFKIISDYYIYLGVLTASISITIQVKYKCHQEKYKTIMCHQIDVIILNTEKHLSVKNYYISVDEQEKCLSS